MDVGEVCTREVVTARAGMTVFEAAKIMRERHVGDVVLVEPRGDRQIPIGIVTDRDIVIDGVAVGDIEHRELGSLVVRELIKVRANASIDDALEMMSQHGVRRVPVVDEGGYLCGILAVEDLLEVFAVRVLRLLGVSQRASRNEKSLIDAKRVGPELGPA